MGVRAEQSSRSSETAVMGRLLTLDSTSANSVLSSVSLSSPSATALFRLFSVICTRTFPNSAHMGGGGGGGGSGRLKDPLDTLLLQLRLNLFFVPTRNRLFELSVRSYIISAPVRPNLFRRSSSTYELVENHNEIICFE